ncbi:hypothetical protein AVEN_92591-1 [Araneus ventricosus]|uniref:Integrase catalytic domain-containing protein n=1 Tax=Araneus ventricosus TaxID=182803 RepID=A0A4Y2AIF5_ARAVE|nr:hypothetical protein AVEN_92591-1 [Araneus ventricosus]
MYTCRPSYIVLANSLERLYLSGSEVQESNGSHSIHSAAYHPQSNGIKKLHRHLKNSLIAHKNLKWTVIFTPGVIGFTHFHQERFKSATSTELVYGTTLRLPSDLLSDGSILNPTITLTYCSIGVCLTKEPIRKKDNSSTAHHGAQQGQEATGSGHTQPRLLPCMLARDNTLGSPSGTVTTLNAIPRKRLLLLIPSRLTAEMTINQLIDTTETNSAPPIQRVDTHG